MCGLIPESVLRHSGLELLCGQRLLAQGAYVMMWLALGVVLLDEFNVLLVLASAVAPFTV